jgi:hypothetical protein
MNISRRLVGRSRCTEHSKRHSPRWRIFHRSRKQLPALDSPRLGLWSHVLTRHRFSRFSFFWWYSAPTSIPQVLISLRPFQWVSSSTGCYRKDAWLAHVLQGW